LSRLPSQIQEDIDNHFQQNNVQAPLYFLEIDIDEASPYGGIKSFLIHVKQVMLNLIRRRRTKLLNRRIGGVASENPTVRENVSRLLNALGMADLLDIASDNGDRVWAWPKSDELLVYLIMNKWDVELLESSELFHHSRLSFRERGDVIPAMHISIRPLPNKSHSPPH
jgi:hypothetical protein